MNYSVSCRPFSGIERTSEHSFRPTPIDRQLYITEITLCNQLQWHKHVIIILYRCLASSAKIHFNWYPWIFIFWVLKQGIIMFACDET
ncbi:hypothetical protein P692DRAFT_20247825 [Suillus brevipes Sb2]|nr:hypothetical protein P692DRAFT_20247825 [Suillus brevipes Sb2]